MEQDSNTSVGQKGRFYLTKHIWVPQEHGGHWGGDPKMQAMLFRPGLPDPLGLRADARAGALAVLCGVAALDSIDSGRSVAVAPLLAG